jgi:hypothetical protein
MEEDDDVARLLLGSAAGDMPGAEGRARARTAALASVGVGASVGLVAGTAKGAGQAASWVALKWLAIASLPVALATAGYLKVTSRTEPAPVTVAPAFPVARLQQPSATPLVAAQPAASVAPSAEPPRTTAKPNETAAHPALASLQKEITELDAARHALARGDVSVLDRYLAEHPRGALREQALWMKISSLQQSGRHAEASALAKRLLAAYPNGAFAAKARGLATP